MIARPLLALAILTATLPAQEDRPDPWLDARRSKSGTIRLTDQFGAVGLRHPGMTDLVVTPDGRFIASVGAERMRVWETATGRLARTWLVPGAPGDLAVGPDGKLLATAHAGNDRSIVWDLATGARLLTFTGHRAPVGAVAFGPDGKVLASGGLDGRVFLWDLASGQEIRSMVLGGGPDVTRIEFSGDGRRLLALGSSTAVWETGTGALVRRLGAGEHSISADGQRLARAGDSAVEIVDLETGRIVGRHADFRRARFVAGGRLVLFGGPAGAALLEPGSDRPRPLTAAPADEIALGGRWLVLVRGEGIHRVALEGAEAAGEDPDGERPPVVALRPLAGDRLLFLAGSSVRNLDLATGRIEEAAAFDPALRSLAADPAGRWLAVVDDEGGFHIRGPGVAATDRLPESDSVFDMACSCAAGPDGEWIALGGVDRVDLVETRTGRVLESLESIAGGAQDTWAAHYLAIDPTGRRIYLGMSSRGIRVWERGTARADRLLDASLFGPFDVSGDGQRIAACDANRIRIWRADRLEPVTTIEVGVFLTSLLFTPDAASILTLQDDGWLTVWSTETGRERDRIRIAGDGRSMALAGDRLLVGTAAGTINVYALDAGD